MQALVVNSLIHANRDISFLQTLLRQLISVASFGKLSYSVSLQNIQRQPVVDQVPCLVQSPDRAAREGARTLNIERVKISFSDDAPERVATAYEVDNHPVMLAGLAFRSNVLLVNEYPLFAVGAAAGGTRARRSASPASWASTARTDQP